MIAYSNISAIKTAIYDAEATIAVYDGVIARRIKEAEADAATSRRGRSSSTARESRRTSSSDVFSKELDDEERERRKRKRRAEETQGRSDAPDLVDRIMKIKMMTSNAPLISTPAGHYSSSNSLKPL